MKPLKDTKIGQWLKSNTPGVLDTVGDILPDKGALGIVKNIIKNTTIDDKKKEEFNQLAADFELEIEMLQNEDRKSARDMQIVALGQDDKFIKRFVAYFTSFLALATFSLIAGLYYLEIPQSNKDIVYMCLGLFIGAFSASVTFWMGSSMSSKSKESMIDKFINRK